MATREQLLKDLRDWQALDKFTAQEDVDYARQRIKELAGQIAAMDAANRPGHMCKVCRRSDQGPTFLGFHAHGRGEVCDDCAQTYGCECCAELAKQARRNMWEPFLEKIGVDPDDVEF